MSDHYIEVDGKPVQVDDVLEWARAFEKEDRRVAMDSIGEVCISTVFLGLDHQFGDGPPLIYETLVMGGEMDHDMDRYSTRGEAESGHADMVARVRKELDVTDTQPTLKGDSDE